MTIQTQPLFCAGKQYLIPHFHNQLWAPVTIRGVTSNQNKYGVYMVLHSNDLQVF